MFSAMEDQSCDKSAKTVSHHLPRSPRSLAEKEIAGKGGDCSGHKACFRAEGNTCDHNDRRGGLEAGNHDGNAGGHCQGAHDGDGDQLPCLRLSLFKGEEEGKHSLNDDKGTGEVIPPSGELRSEEERCRDHHKNQEQIPPHILLFPYRHLRQFWIHLFP